MGRAVAEGFACWNRPLVPSTMSDDTETLKQALSAARKGWNRYFVTLGTLTLALATDVLTGAHFLRDQADVEVLQLTLPRIAFSFAYSVVFLAFVLWAMVSARTVHNVVREHADQGNLLSVTGAPEYRLWTLSPLSPSLWLRRAFWLPAGCGVIGLASVTVIHLFGDTPDKEIMDAFTYRAIGFGCLAILVFTVAAFTRWIYRDWEAVREYLTTRATGGDT